MREAEGVYEQKCPYKRYEVRSDKNGGFSFGIMRDEETCSEHENPTTNSDDSNNDPVSIAEADLLAQERMAHWTTWIGILTGFGLVVLYFTLVVTRQAVEETRNIGQKQSRAYVSPQGVYLWFDRAKIKNIVVDIANLGQTPATKVGFFIKAGTAPIKKIEAYPLPTDPIGGNMRATLGPGKNVFTNAYDEDDAVFVEEQIDGLKASATYFYVLGRIEYEDAFGDAHKTYFRAIQTGFDISVSQSCVSLIQAITGNEAD